MIDRNLLENVLYSFDLLEEQYGKPNNARTLALIHGFLNSTYSLFSNIAELMKSKKDDPAYAEVNKWWLEKKETIQKRDELLSAFYTYTNALKHKEKVPFSFQPQALMSTIIIPKGTNCDRIDGKYGASYIKDKDSPFQRRENGGFIEGTFRVNISNPPKIHLGESLQSSETMYLLQLLKTYYAQLYADFIRKYYSVSKVM